MKRKDFIINGKLYSVTDALLLCVCEGDFFGTLSLYRTKKGAFFTVEENIFGGTKANTVDRKTAQKILCDNAAGIINENYEKVFGKVAKG